MKWHKINSIEDLPKKDDEYIIYLVNENIVSTAYLDRDHKKIPIYKEVKGKPYPYYEECEYAWIIDEEYGCYAFPHEVTHWMDFPEPPKG